MLISGHPLWFISRVGTYFLSVLDLCMTSKILLIQMEDSVEIFKIFVIISRVQNEVISVHKLLSSGRCDHGGISGPVYLCGRNLSGVYLLCGSC